MSAHSYPTTGPGAAFTRAQTLTRADARPRQLRSHWANNDLAICHDPSWRSIDRRGAIGSTLGSSRSGRECATASGCDRCNLYYSKSSPGTCFQANLSGISVSMPAATRKTSRLSRGADIGRLVAEGRRRAKLSQQEFASKLGVSRKTVSDLERGVAHHVSLQTALRALALAGFVLEASVRRPPTLSEVMAQRAEHQARVDRLTESAVTAPGRGSSPAKRSPRRRAI